MHVNFATVDPWSPRLSIDVDHWPLIIGGNGSSDVVLHDQWVSDEHCRIELLDGTLEVVDLNSQNGTLVNHRVVRRSALSSGDMLTVGIRTFRVQCRSSN